MTSKLALALGAALCTAPFLTTPALAQAVPPANAMPLSALLATVEKAQPVRGFLEVEWEDEGYWDVKFVNPDNRRVRLRLDPITAEAWSRRPR